MANYITASAKLHITIRDSDINYLLICQLSAAKGEYITLLALLLINK